MPGAGATSRASPSRPGRSASSPRRRTTSRCALRGRLAPDVGARRGRFEVVGFLMWGIDDADGSCWLGGLLVDAAHQGRGRRAAPPSSRRCSLLRTETGRTRVRPVVPAPRTSSRRRCTRAWVSSRPARRTTARSSPGSRWPERSRGRVTGWTRHRPERTVRAHPAQHHLARLRRALARARLRPGRGGASASSS